MNWQPIETAPTLTPILVVESGVVQYAAVQLYQDGSWMDLVTEDVCENFRPTHWMPLPEPPEATKEKAT